MSTDQIARHRKQIDSLDLRLLVLLNRRARLALKLGALKQKAGLPLQDRTRESLILERLLLGNSGPLDGGGVRRIFQRFFRESRRLQRQTLTRPKDARP